MNNRFVLFVPFCGYFLRLFVASPSQKLAVLSQIGIDPRKTLRYSPWQPLQDSPVCSPAAWLPPHPSEEI